MIMTEQFDLENNVEHLSIAPVARANTDFRRVLWTGPHAQIVLQTLQPGEEIGAEVHEHGDQILNFAAGTGRADIAGISYDVEAGMQFSVPAGTLHNFINTGDMPLVLYTIYAPPEHAAGAAYATKEEADQAEESGADKPPTP